MPNTINLRLLDNKNIIAEMQTIPLAQENSYKIIAGEENATIFKIISKPAQYEFAQYTVEMVNSQGYRIKADDIGLVEKNPNEYIIENDEFPLPIGMAVAGYGWALIRAYQTNEEGKEEKVPFVSLKIKVWNTIPNWKDGVSSSTQKITTVTVNGEAVETFNADIKLDKVTGSQNSTKAYCVDLSGEQITKNVQSANYNSSIASWGSSVVGKQDKGGFLVTSTPIEPYQASNKQYVDDAVANAGGKLYMHKLFIVFNMDVVREIIFSICSYKSTAYTIEELASGDVMAGVYVCTYKKFGNGYDSATPPTINTIGVFGFEPMTREFTYQDGSVFEYMNVQSGTITSYIPKEI